MTIDEFLNQARILKRKRDKAEKHLAELESLVDPKAFSLDGLPVCHSSTNSTETRLLDYLDAGQEFRKINEVYTQYTEQLQKSINYLLHWEALLIEQIYIYNVHYGYDDLYGIDHILNTKSRSAMITKLNIAKGHLADLLIKQGVEIEK